MGKQVGNFIKTMREERGLSQGDVARLLDLKTAQSISNIERGVSPLPKAKIKKFAAILGVQKKHLMKVVLDEVSQRYSKELGVGGSALVVSKSLSSDETELLGELVQKMQALKNNERSAFRKKVERILQ